MFTISVETHFWAPHRLSLPNGSKESSHSHNWAVAADVTSNELNSAGVVMDFQQLKTTLDNIVEQLGASKTLDSLNYFRSNSPSAENVAKYIYEKLRTRLPENVHLSSVRVVEEPGCSAKFAE